MNSTSIASTSTATSSLSTATPTAVFENVQIFDALTQSQFSSNADHWFAIKVDVSVTEGFSGDIFLTVPEQFTDFPEGTYDVFSDVNSIGSVTHNSSSVFKVTFGNITKDYVGTFNFLTKLAEKPSEPGTVEYTFDTSSGSTFSSSMVFQTASSTISSIDSGIDEAGRVYFALSIPYTEYPGDLEFSSVAEDSYQFVASSFQIVNAVDEFQNPTSVVNTTAAVNDSDESTISYSFSSNISGGRGLRIIYFLSVGESATSVRNVGELRYPTLTAYKRDISIIFDTTAYLTSVANIDLTGVNSITVMTNGADNSSNSTSTITSTGITSSVPSVIASTSTYSNESLTYTVITRTNNGEITEITQLIPVSTLSTSTYTNTSYASYPSSQSTSSRTDKNLETGSTLASSSLASPTKITSSTNNVDSESKSTSTFSSSGKNSSSTIIIGSNSKSTSTLLAEKLSSSTSKAAGTSTTSSSSNTVRSGAENTSISSEDQPLSYATVVTETVHGKLSTYTSWIASCTAGCTSPELESTTKTNAVGESTGLQISTSLKTKTLSGEETEVGSLVAINTLGTAVGAGAEKTETYQITSTSGEEVTTLLQFLGVSSSTANGSSYGVLTQYSGFANRVEYGFGSLLVAVLAILI